mgnify:FL=1
MGSFGAWMWLLISTIEKLYLFCYSINNPFITVKAIYLQSKNTLEEGWVIQYKFKAASYGGLNDRG